MNKNFLVSSQYSLRALNRYYETMLEEKDIFEDEIIAS